MMRRPTRQARAGFRSPAALPPGVSAPFGRSIYYTGDHHGQDYFWLLASTAKSLGLTTAASLEVLAPVSGPIYHVNSKGLGDGLWQQINATARVYLWHLSARHPKSGATVTTDSVVGTMGNTGTAAGKSVHLHLEVRVYPYGENNRVDPEPYFTRTGVAGEIEDDMDLTDKIKVRDPKNWAVVQGEATLGDYFMGSNYREQRAEMQLNGALPSILTQIRDAVKALATPDAAAQAKALAPLLVPQLIAGIGDGLATDADLDGVQQTILTALGQNQTVLLEAIRNLPDEQLAALGLQRRAS